MRDLKDEIDLGRDSRTEDQKIIKANKKLGLPVFIVLVLLIGLRRGYGEGKTKRKVV